MSQFGYLIFYSTEPHGDVVEMTERFYRSLVPQKPTL